MNMVIMGGGKVGWNLARIMLERKHFVNLIETDRIRCRRLADDLDATVLRRGDELVAVSEERSQKALMKVLTALKK